MNPFRLDGFSEYGKWYLGVNDEKPEETEGHYEFPYGDFKNIHRCGVLSAESRAGQYQHYDIENATAHLHGMLDGRKAAPAPKPAPASAGKDSARSPAFGAMTRSPFQRFTTQKTRLNTTLKSKHVISGK